jgi:hypothetical protein
MDFLNSWQGSSRALRSVSGSLPTVSNTIRFTLPPGMIGIAFLPITSIANQKAAAKVYANIPSPGPTGTTFIPNTAGFWGSSGTNNRYCPEVSTSPVPGCPNCPTGELLGFTAICMPSSCATLT